MANINETSLSQDKRELKKAYLAANPSKPAADSPDFRTMFQKAKLRRSQGKPDAPPPAKADSAKSKASVADGDHDYRKKYGLATNRITFGTLLNKRRPPAPGTSAG